MLSQQDRLTAPYLLSLIDTFITRKKKKNDLVKRGLTTCAIYSSTTVTKHMNDDTKNS
jgi:hypothetical protein